MFKLRTLFIVGAGASCEFGLPPGSGLAKLIAQKVDISSKRYRSYEEEDDGYGNGDPDIALAMQRLAPHNIDPLIAAANVIRDGVQMSSSIDDFLDVHGDNETIKTIGKIAIVKSILEAERGSKLFFDRSNIYNRMKVSDFEDSWLIKFVRMLGRNVAKKDREYIFQNVSFISFNYDRCIEHCLYHALQQLYSISAMEAGEILKTLTVLHPYGKVGELKTDAQPGIEFGGEHHALSANYIGLSNDIKTYTEQVDDEPELAALHDQMRRAEKIVFLGFAYHDQNMKLLRPDSGINGKRVYGTAYGMSHGDVDVVRAQILNFFMDSDRLNMKDFIDIRNDLTCAGLFDQYTRSLPD